MFLFSLLCFPFSLLWFIISIPFIIINIIVNIFLLITSVFILLGLVVVFYRWLKHVIGFGPIDRLTDSQIKSLTRDLVSPQAWHNFYVAEARRISRGFQPVKDPALWLSDLARRAVYIRIEQARSHPDRSAALVRTSWLAAIPFLGAAVNCFVDHTSDFRYAAIRSVGLGGNSAQAAKYIALAKSDASAAWKEKIVAASHGGWGMIGKEALKHNWWEHAASAQMLQHEILSQLALNFGVGAVQGITAGALGLSPFIIPGISAVMAAWECDAKMERVLRRLEPMAVEFHLQVFVVNALAEVYDGAELEGDVSGQVVGGWSF
ncbi:hypothetical protein QBC43DRAFT_352125 [Cladorrhinum sp. PSN259]|nr:hypothetical protein QBC43DRAFT_352125 [Cladorrhinum sp. PSN259]